MQNDPSASFFFSSEISRPVQIFINRIDTLALPSVDLDLLPKGLHLPFVDGVSVGVGPKQHKIKTRYFMCSVYAEIKIKIYIFISCLPFPLPQ